MRLSLFALALATAALPATAETTISFGGTLEYYLDPAGSGTSDEIDVTVYGELDFGGAYAGVGALKSNDNTLDELSLNFGYRGEMGSIGYDLGYVHTAYPNDSASNYGELGLGLSADLSDQVSGSVYLGHDVTNKLSNLEIGAAFAASDAIELSANFVISEVDAAPNEKEWDFGMTYSMSDTTAVDLRYYDGSEYVDGYFGVVFSFDTLILR